MRQPPVVASVSDDDPAGGVPSIKSVKGLVSQREVGVHY